MRSVLMKQCDVFEAELSVYYQHHKFVLRAYENTGHFASREGISRDAGHMGRILLATLNARPSISELAVSHSVCDERSVCKLRHWVLSALSLVSASFCCSVFDNFEQKAKLFMKVVHLLKTLVERRYCLIHYN